jgi:predicted metal-dependent enzyme (double-stranded beta helix superfamily)
VDRVNLDPELIEDVIGLLMVFTPYINEPEQLSDLRTSPKSLEEGISFMARLASDPAFLHSRVFPFLERAEMDEDWYVAYRQDAADDSYSLQVFVWPPGSRTQIHDHSTWGAFRCVAGSVLEERYERLDEGYSPTRRA